MFPKWPALQEGYACLEGLDHEHRRCNRSGSVSPLSSPLSNVLLIMSQKSDLGQSYHLPPAILHLWGERTTQIRSCYDTSNRQSKTLWTDEDGPRLSLPHGEHYRYRLFRVAAQCDYLSSRGSCQGVLLRQRDSCGGELAKRSQYLVCEADEI